MTGKRNHSSPLTYSCIFRNALIASCLVAVSFTVPLSNRNSDNNQPWSLTMDDRGVYFRRVILGIDFERTNLSSEVSSKVSLPLLHATAHISCVIIIYTHLSWAFIYFFGIIICTILSLQLSGTMFYDLVCPLFEIYRHMQQTLQNLPEGDESISALVFVTKRQTEAVCDQVNTSYTHNDHSF